MQIQNEIKNQKFFVIYANYESDFTGAFDVIACADTLPPEVLPDSVKVNITSGKYVTFLRAVKCHKQL
nr:hypothetical protein [Vibrio sagamiensis]